MCSLKNQPKKNSANQVLAFTILRILLAYIFSSAGDVATGGA